jgi:hypothetical protein
MTLSAASLDRPSADAIHRCQDVAAPAATAFAKVCQIESWPVWLSFLRSVRRTEPHLPLELGSEVAVRSVELPGDDEELFEVDRFIHGYHLSLVGAYSCRRRIDVRVEQKSERCKIVVRVDYPVYGGAVSTIVDRLTRRRRLAAALEASLLHFKGLVEFEPADGVLLEV